MDWISAARELLAHPPSHDCPQLHAALRAVEAGEVGDAHAALAELDETPRLIATFMVEIGAARAGVDPAALDRLCLGFHAVEAHVVSLDDLPRRLGLTWADEVGVQLPASSVAARDAYGHGQWLQVRTAERLLESGRAEAAIAHAERIDAHARETVADVWARLGLCFAADDPRRDAALLQAARAGAVRPMIQDGGEEASAFGAALRRFADGGVPADHPAVRLAHAGLLALAKTRARKDVRSYGVMVAGVAAGLRAEREQERGWLELARALEAAVWSDDLAARVGAAVALGSHACGLLDDAGLRERGRQWLPNLDHVAPELLRAFARGELSMEDKPEHLLALRRAGVDVDARIEAALNHERRIGDPKVERFVRGCRMGLPDARLEALLAEVRDASRAEALVHGAALGFGDEPERRAAYLARGYPEGDRFGNYTEDLVHLLPEAKRREGERFYARHGETSALANLAAAALALGSIDEAARIVGRLGQPVVSEAWVPFYRRGNRSFTVDPPRAPGSNASPPASLRAAKTGDELLALARALLADGDTKGFAELGKASRLQKWTKKKADVAALARLRVLEGQLDEAVAALEALVTGRVDHSSVGWGLRGFAEELRESTAVVDAALSERIFAVVAAVHPQSATWALAALAEVTIARAPADEVERVCATIHATTHRLFTRSGDHVFADLGMARGRIARADPLGAGRELDQALEHATQRGFYFDGEAALHLFAPLRAGLDAERFTAAGLQLLLACPAHHRDHYAQVMAIERGLRVLWASGDAAVTLAWLADPRVPQAIGCDVRRSIWADIAHVPDPLEVLAAAWPEAPVEVELAAECVAAAAHALARAGHPASAAVDALVGERPVT